MDMDTKGSIQVSCVSLVKPAKPTTRHVLYMSGVDQLLRVAPPSRSILFYNTDTDAAAAADVLRKGLASALVAFYPLAGQLALDDDGHLAIDCNDTGVVLIEASCKDIQFTNLQLQLDFPVQPLFRRLVPMDDHSTSDHIVEPVASVQVTSFVGGLTLGVAVAHSVADGYSFWMFIRALAEACKGEPLSMFPLHARSLLKSDNFLLNKLPSPPATAWQLLREDDGGSFKDAITEPSTGISHKQRIASIPPEQLQQKCIHISKNMLQTLQMVCRSTHKHPSSSFDALSAYLWKRLTMAQDLPDETRVAFRVPLDIRRRIIPPLTLAFFGNAVVAVMVSTTAKELKAECLGATAARIRCEIQHGDDAYIKKAIVDREGLDLREIVEKAEEVIFLIRNASHFPVYQASAFGWGEAKVVRPPWGDSETTMTWYPSKEAGGIDVLTALSASTSALFFSPSLYPDDPLLPHHHAIFEPAS